MSEKLKLNFRALRLMGKCSSCHLFPTELYLCFLYLLINLSLAVYDSFPTSVHFPPQRNELRGIQIQMGRGGLGSTGPCFERQVGSGKNQVPRPLSSLSQQRKDLELTYCATAPGSFGSFCGLLTSHTIFLLSLIPLNNKFGFPITQMILTSIKSK